ncbi:helix-turn-helix transcriptional regulator [Streptococcus hyointestinalis]|nr:helix-turn-helix transcriptional regulator [Streptococcus hyointestinalis]
MLITYSISEKIRSKRGKQDLTKTEVAKQLGVSRTTLSKLEKGNYDAPKRIYESVMNWLVEDY